VTNDGTDVVGIRLPTDIHVDLLRIAAGQGRPIEDVLVSALTDYVIAHPATTPRRR
jgi:hypothetical protein